MPKPDYAVFTVDLTVANPTPGATLVGPGQGFDSVTVLSVPAGAVVNLHFGSNSQPWPVGNLQGVTIETTTQDGGGCIIPCDDGLTVDNPAGAGSLVLGVSFAKAGVALPNT